jgi:hypothetical protein
MSKSRFALISANVVAAGAVVFIAFAAPTVGATMPAADGGGGSTTTTTTPPPPPPGDGNPWND